MRTVWILLVIPLTYSQDKPLPSANPEKSSDFVTESLSFILRSSWDVFWLGCPALLEVVYSAWSGFRLVTRNFQRLFRSERHRPATTPVQNVHGNFSLAIAALGILEHRASLATTCGDLSLELSDADLNISPLNQANSISDFSLAFNSASLALESKRRLLCWDPLKSGVVTMGAVFAGFLCAILSSRFIKVK